MHARTLMASSSCSAFTERSQAAASSCCAPCRPPLLGPDAAAAAGPAPGPGVLPGGKSHLRRAFEAAAAAAAVPASNEPIATSDASVTDGDAPLAGAAFPSACPARAQAGPRPPEVPASAPPPKGPGAAACHDGDAADDSEPKAAAAGGCWAPSLPAVAGAAVLKPKGLNANAGLAAGEPLSHRGTRC